MIKRLEHWFDGYRLARAQRQLIETRRHLERQRAENEAAIRWVQRELERLAVDQVCHSVRAKVAA